MAYDSKRNRVVLFGGDSMQNGRGGDTWEWDGSFWTQMDDIGPAPRRDAAMVYDRAWQASILFGGLAAEPDPYRGDTWRWDGVDWTQLSDSGPRGRVGHSMAFDSSRNRTVLFGGQASDNSVLSDTWEFDGQDWTQQEDTGPSPRAGHSMSYDGATARVVLFGGSGANSLGLADTWAWDGKGWVQIAEFGPVPRTRGAMVAAGNRLVLFGGVSALAPAPNPQVLGDTWEFDGQHWTQRQDIGPGPRWMLAMTFDSSRRRVVLFGGARVYDAPDPDAFTAQLLGDTWEHPQGPSPAAPLAPVTPSSVKVQSIEVPATVHAGDDTPMQVTLSGLLTSSTSVTVSWTDSDGVRTLLTSIMIPAGQTNGQGVVVFPGGLIGTSLTVAAQTEGTPPATAVVRVVA